MVSVKSADVSSQTCEGLLDITERWTGVYNMYCSTLLEFQIFMMGSLHQSYCSSHCGNETYRER